MKDLKSNQPMRIERKLSFLIEFNAEAEVPPKAADSGSGKIEISVNGKPKYRIEYSLANEGVFANLTKNVEAIEEELGVIIQTTIGFFGHRTFLRTVEMNDNQESNIKSLSVARHVPKLIDPVAAENAPLSPMGIEEVIIRGAAASPKMKQYVELLLELNALSTVADFSRFKEGYDLILPRVKAAKKAAMAYLSSQDKDWAKKIFAEFPEYLYYAPDLIVRLTAEAGLVPEKLRLAIDETGADLFRPSHIALELVARVGGASVYQYSVKHLEEIKAGRLPRSGKTRKRKHKESITRGEAITLISQLLNG